MFPGKSSRPPSKIPAAFLVLVPGNLVITARGRAIRVEVGYSLFYEEWKDSGRPRPTR